jgi:hypothetical protein
MNRSVFYRVGGELWFLGFYSNNFEDREAEVITQEAHEEYATWVKSTGIQPPITIFHQPHYEDALHLLHYLALVRGQVSTKEFSENLRELYRPYAIAETKAVIPVDGFNLVVGKVYDNKREVVERLMGQATGWGMSHGFIVVSADDKTINKYRSFEFSILPGEAAANRVTSIGFLERTETMEAELKGISKEDRQLIRQIFNDDVDPNEIEKAVEKAKSMLAGFLGSKMIEDVMAENTEETVVEEEVITETEEVEETPVEDVPAETDEEVEQKAYTTLRVKLMDDFKMKELAEALTAVGERLEKLEAGLETLSGNFGAAQKQIEALKQSDDEKVALQFDAPNWPALMGQRSVTATKEADQGEAELLEKLKKDLPTEVDEKAKNENPLYLGFYKEILS